MHAGSPWSRKSPKHLAARETAPVSGCREHARGVKKGTTASLEDPEGPFGSAGI